MTRTEIENEMTAIAQERGEIFDELDAIAVEDDPLCGTPQRGNPLQCSCLENPMDRGAWWTIVHKLTNNS